MSEHTRAKHMRDVQKMQAMGGKANPSLIRLPSRPSSSKKKKRETKTQTNRVGKQILSIASFTVTVNPATPISRSFAKAEIPELRDTSPADRPPINYNSPGKLVKSDSFLDKNQDDYSLVHFVCGENPRGPPSSPIPGLPMVEFPGDNDAEYATVNQTVIPIRDTPAVFTHEMARMIGCYYEARFVDERKVDSLKNSNAPSISDFIRNLVRAVKCSSESLINASIYVERIIALAKIDNVSLTYQFIRRLIIAATLVACKFNEDDIYSEYYLKMWSKLAQVTKEDIADIEVIFLKKSQFRMAISPKEFQQQFQMMRSPDNHIICYGLCGCNFVHYPSLEIYAPFTLEH